LSAIVAELSAACAELCCADRFVVSRVAMVTPEATCWPGCTVTVATRPLVAKSRLAVFVGWIVPVAPIVCRTVPVCAATVRYCGPDERVRSQAVTPPATIATTRMMAITWLRPSRTPARRRRLAPSRDLDRTNDTSATPILRWIRLWPGSRYPSYDPHGPSSHHVKLGRS